VANTVGRLALFASLTLGGVACNDSTGPTTPIAAYTLTAIGSAGLPTVMYAEEGYSLEVTAGTIELVEPDEYTASLTVIETVDGIKSTYVDQESGTWAMVNGVIELSPLAGSTFTATWSGTRLTVNRDDVIYVYEMSNR
jgi:hypothetical protein